MKFQEKTLRRNQSWAISIQSTFENPRIILILSSRLRVCAPGLGDKVKDMRSFTSVRPRVCMAWFLLKHQGHLYVAVLTSQALDATFLHDFPRPSLRARAYMCSGWKRQRQRRGSRPAARSLARSAAAAASE